MLDILRLSFFTMHHCGDDTVRATGLVNGKPGFSDPRGTKTPEPIDTKLDVSNYVEDLSPHAKFGAPAPTRGRATNLRNLRSLLGMNLNICYIFHCFFAKKYTKFAL